MNSEPFSIAVIGGGAASISFLHYFIETLSLNIPPGSIKVTVFERKPIIGPGKAYQMDLQCLLMNRKAQAMSVLAEDPEHFWKWLKNAQPPTRESEMGDYGTPFLRRSLFGTYLQDFFEEIKDCAAKKGICLQTKHSEVIHLKKGVHYELITRDKEKMLFDCVILCTGNTEPVDLFNLSGESQYIHEPYPLHRFLSLVPKTACVAILGSSLTAIDISVALQSYGHTGKIHLISRNGEIPSVRGVINHYQLKHLTKEALEKMSKYRPRGITLWNIGRLFRRELLAVGENWRKVLFPKSFLPSPLERLEQELIASKSERKWQSILLSTNEVIEEYWQALTAESKLLFLKHFHREFAARRNPMPLTNAQKIYQMLRSGQLEIKAEIRHIDVFSDGTFFAEFDNNISSSYDWVINATGPCRYIEGKNRSGIIASMLNCGYAKKNPYGGIQVDFDTGAVVNINDQSDPNLRAVGHITNGTYYYISSLEMIVRRSRQIASEMVSHINNQLKRHKVAY